MTGPEHLADPTSWRCRTCAQEWPCPDARRRLADEYRNDRVALGVYMARCWIAAENDLAALTGNRPDAGDLYVRFIFWTARAHRGPVHSNP